VTVRDQLAIGNRRLAARIIGYNLGIGRGDVLVCCLFGGLADVVGVLSACIRPLLILSISAAGVSDIVWPM